jgi:hypothetical protein
VNIASEESVASVATVHCLSTVELDMRFDAKGMGRWPGNDKSRIAQNDIARNTTSQLVPGIRIRQDGARITYADEVAAYERY